MDEQRAAILAELREFLESAISKAKLNIAGTEHRSAKLLGRIGAHGAVIEPVKSSTLHDHLRGRRRNLPSWTWFSNLWAALVVIAAENNVDPAELGTLDEWRAVYEAVDRKLRKLPKPPRGADAPTRLVSPRTTWWSDYADVVPTWFERYLNLEPLANLVRCYEDVYVPGLLQTKEYAEAVIRLEHGRAPEAEIERRVELRMIRQRLTRNGGRHVWSVIHERALRDAPVDRTIMRDQLRHLLTAPDHTPIQVLPYGAPVCEGIAVPITLLRFSHEGLPDTFYLEQGDGALYPDGFDIQSLYLRQLNGLTISAVRPKESRRIIARLIEAI